MEYGVLEKPELIWLVSIVGFATGKPLEKDH
jgi:hypothetical protein